MYISKQHRDQRPQWFEMDLITTPHPTTGALEDNHPMQRCAQYFKSGGYFQYQFNTYLNLPLPFKFFVRLFLSKTVLYSVTLAYVINRWLVHTFVHVVQENLLDKTGNHTLPSYRYRPSVGTSLAMYRT